MKNPTEFIREVKQEASKVTWSAKKETTLTTIMVFIFVLLAALFFLLIDQIMSFGVRFITGG
ncbi:MAG: preprotein translocase subunit SecE [Pseudomonadota bacterium]|nr:preprotein translocase subunit SecE [Pseudomonadota bacterium]MEC8876209.1 preprotein translocase subunit SecE [Pseudomonadota bacterium]MED5339205.1 preprotein translocase subunit SecE [Pseudomonadota bacterium]|tara:strand:- start:91 stop:276 length:186 start_codon:yes stop_codon:yes gene_type:complete